MKQTIKLYDIYSADLFTRSRASELRSSIDEKADEVCNIIDDIPSKAFTFINQNEDVATMMTKVREGRNRERIRGVGNAKIYEFKDLESLSAFLSAT